MTDQELINSINLNIADNNSRKVTPQKMREVLFDMMAYTNERTIGSEVITASFDTSTVVSDERLIGRKVLAVFETGNNIPYAATKNIDDDFVTITGGQVAPGTVARILVYREVGGGPAINFTTDGQGNIIDDGSGNPIT